MPAMISVLRSTQSGIIFRLLVVAVAASCFYNYNTFLKHQQPNGELKQRSSDMEPNIFVGSPRISGMLAETSRPQHPWTRSIDTSTTLDATASVGTPSDKMQIPNDRVEVSRDVKPPPTKVNSRSDGMELNIEYNDTANRTGSPKLSVNMTTHPESVNHNQSFVDLPAHDSGKSITQHNATTIPKGNSSASKLILFWTPDQGKRTMWFGNPEIWKPYFLRKHCKYNTCEFTDDKSRVNQADVLMFSEGQLHSEKLDWPPNRTSRQLYVHHLAERPGPWHEFIKNYENRINLTLNYRLSADISIPFRQLFQLKRPLENYQMKTPLQERSRSVLWVASNCDTQSKREGYVRELARHIDVDIFGQCGNLTCDSKTAGACFPEWQKTYKFYLSFENAICEDYVTEKFYNPLKYEIVPVVLSGPRYTPPSVPGTYINASDYDSPKDLANFLTTVAANETTYNSYFDWNAKYYYGPSMPYSSCKICEAAHIHTDKPAHSDYYDWWFGNCDNGLVDRMRQQGGWL